MFFFGRKTKVSYVSGAGILFSALMQVVVWENIESEFV